MLGRWLRSRNRSAGRSPTSADVATTLDADVAWWHVLDTSERARVADLTAHLVERFHWEAARGFGVTDEMRVTIAAHGALMLLGVGDDRALDNVATVIVHPSTVIRSGVRNVGGSVVSGSPVALAGEAHHRGPVLISWRVARRDMRRLGTGTNVVIHELAHKLDMLDGLLDGTPPVDDALRRRWIDVCEAELAGVRRGDRGPLRPYAGTNPAEFFAVASEVFFDRPDAIVTQRPELYDVLRAFYGQDPAGRWERTQRRLAGVLGADPAEPGQ